MKFVTLFGCILITCMIMSCSDDNGNNNNVGKAAEMEVTGALTLNFSTDNVGLNPPNLTRPNYLIVCNMNDGNKTHTLSLTIDTTWVDSTVIDFTRGFNKLTFAYDSGKDSSTYHGIVDSKLTVDILTTTRIKGSLNFTAKRIGVSDKTITVVNGKIDKSK